MLIEELIKKKKALNDQINRSFIAGLKEILPIEMQSLVVYRIETVLQDGTQERPEFIFGFRPKKEMKALIELAEAFQFDLDLPIACIPMSLDGSTLSTTKEFNSVRKVKDLIKKYHKINQHLTEVFEELGDDLGMEMSLGNNLNANIYKLT